ncbi:MAG: MFS transporter [Planctomycetota bacterium]|jgi:FSR family fosmidomycin resistance protein-like MFS transporter
MTRAAPVVAGSSAAANGILPRLGAVVVSHTLVDIYSAFVPPLLGVLEVRCSLSAAQTAWLLGIGSLSSGLSQPLAAWLSDRLDTRLFAAAGLVLAAVCLSCIGLAHDFKTLVPLFVVGMIGVGIFHPVGASSMGQLADGLPRPGRSFGISLFFVAGMAGGISGAIIVTRLTTLPDGFELLRYLMIPGILLALVLHVAIRRVPHRQHEHHLITFDPAEARARWLSIWLLWTGNALRFTVNMALVYLIVRWAQNLTAASNPGWSSEQVAAEAAPIVGNLNALIVLGMAVGGLTAGALVPSGREKWPMVLVPLAGAPCIAAFPEASLWSGYGLAVLAGVGFAAMIPVTISVGQRLLPHRTSLASAAPSG